MSAASVPANEHRVDRLLDAIELIKQDERAQALVILRELIQADKDFEDAWLWMSVAVDDINQSALCLENVLRINPGNAYAAGALYRLRGSEIRNEHRRGQLRSYRDLSLMAFWVLVLGVLVAIFLSSSTEMLAAGAVVGRMAG